MHNTTLALAAGLAIASSLAPTAATAGGFDGPFAQAGIGFANAHTTLNAPLWISGTLSDSSFVGQIAAGYSRAFGQFNLAANVHYVVGDQKSGKLDYATSGAGSIQFKNRDVWGIDVEPGINLGDTVLAYAKLGYAESGSKATDQWTAGGTSHSESFNASFRGYSYGAGLKYKLGAKLYGMAELQQTHYRSRTWTYSSGYQSSVKPDALTGFIGIGYRF